MSFSLEVKYDNMAAARLPADHRFHNEARKSV